MQMSLQRGKFQSSVKLFSFSQKPDSWCLAKGALAIFAFMLSENCEQTSACWSR